MAFGIDDALLAAMALSSAGNLAGGAIASRGGDEIRPEDLRIPFINPLADPLLSGLSGEALLSLGLDPSALYAQSSPLQRTIAQINALPGVKTQDKNLAISALQQMGIGGSPSGKAAKALANVAAAGGLGEFGADAGAVWRAEQQFQTQQQSFQQQFGPLISGIQGNRISTLAGLAQSGATAAQDIDALTAQFAPQIAQQFQDEADRILAEANVRGFNPSGAIGRLRETQALTQQTQAISQALQLLGGRQDVMTRALLPGTQAAQAASGLRVEGQRIQSNQGISAAGLASAQQEANQRLQAQQAGALGTGIAAGLGSVGDALLLWQILNNPGNQPATQPATGGASDFGSFFNLMNRNVFQGLI
jgi:hypothetical protein